METPPLPEEYFNILNNTNEIQRVLCILDYNQEQCKDILAAAEQIIWPRRELSRVDYRPYILEDKVSIPYHIVNKSKIVIYTPSTDKYQLITDTRCKEYILSFTSSDSIGI